MCLHSLQLFDPVFQFLIRTYPMYRSFKSFEGTRSFTFVSAYLPPMQPWFDSLSGSKSGRTLLIESQQIRRVSALSRTSAKGGRIDGSERRVLRTGRNSIRMRGNEGELRF